VQGSAAEAPAEQALVAHIHRASLVKTVFPERPSSVGSEWAAPGTPLLCTRQFVTVLLMTPESTENFNARPVNRVTEYCTSP